MKSYLIKDTTKEEREKIVADSLEDMESGCDGSLCGFEDMYQDYIDGKRELKEITMSYNKGYITDDVQQERRSCTN